MNVDYELYRLFYEIAEQGSITKASKSLMVSQPALTKQLKKLEGQLGVELFLRTPKGVILTESGSAIYHNIKQAMIHLEYVEKKIINLKELDYGTIKIGINSTLARYFLTPYLEKFSDMYPKIKFHIFTDPSLELIDKLKVGTLDMLICKLPDKVEDSFEVFELGDIHECFVVGKKYKELSGKVTELKELKNYPLLLQTNRSNIKRLLDKIFADYNIQLDNVTEVASASLLIEFTKIGLGIGCVTKEYIEKELKDNTLFELNIVPTIPVRKFGIIKLKDSIFSFAADKLINYILNNNKK